MKPVKLIEAPSNLGLKNTDYAEEPGVCKMPDALSKAGIAAALKAVETISVERSAYVYGVDPITGIRNAEGIFAYSQLLADQVRQAMNDEWFPVVVGGDCSILIGIMLGLRTIGDHGLLFVDGHNDFQMPEQSHSKGAAGMDLALVTGRGPEMLSNIRGMKPYVADSNVVVMGDRYEDGTAAVNQLIRETAITVYKLSSLRKIGLKRALNETLKKFQKNGVRGIWVHVDLDVLNDDVMPAVDSRQPDGLFYEELIMILNSVLSSGQAAGINITIYDPDLDPTGQYAIELVKALENGFCMP